MDSDIRSGQSRMKSALFLTFFTFAMLTNVLGVILKILIDEYNLTYTRASFLNLAFLISYGIFSIFAGITMHKKGYRFVYLTGIALMTAGSFLFGIAEKYTFLLLTLFIAGSGVTFIQVAANPLVRYAGPKKDYTKNLNFVQSLFGFGSFVAPLAIVYMVNTGIGWRPFYYLIVALSLVLFILCLRLEYPRTENGRLSFDSFLSHFRNYSIMSSFIALFFYCGTEGGIAIWMVTYLGEVESIDASIAAWFLSAYWLFLGIGRLLGGRLMKHFPPKSVLSEFTVLAFLSLGIALYSPSQYAVFFFPIIGFFLSVIFPTIYSIAIENEHSGHEIISGILYTAVTGAAIIPSLVGIAADTWGLKSGMSLFFLCLSVVLVKSLTIKRKHVNLEDAGPDAI